MLKSKWKIIIATLLLLLAGGYFLFQRDYSGLKNILPVNTVAPDQALAPANPESSGQPLPAGVSPNILEITGESTHLTPQQKNSMAQWRKQAREMAILMPEAIILNGPASNRAVSLTFDDGPDGVITPQILKVLADRGVKATFFVTGQQVGRFPEQLLSMGAGGHLILSHTYSHRRLDICSEQIVSREVSLADHAIKKVLNQQSGAAVRPPYGAINRIVVDSLQAKGKQVILWSIDTLDWAGDEPQMVAANVIDNVRPGDIILMHSTSGRGNTVKALPLIVEGLQQKGYDMVRLDELLGKRL